MDAPHGDVYCRCMFNRPAHTLVELALVLVILGIIAGLGAPAFMRGRDALAVNAARSELAAAVAITRVTAIRTGGAQLVLDTGTGHVRIDTADGRRFADYPLGVRYGISLSCERAAPVILRFDALGIGRMTNATVRVHRARAEASLTLSAYGRVRT
jgi:type II secretory pathway pseudopilin PulG